MPTDLVLIDTSAWILALRPPHLDAIKDRVDALLRENLAAIMPFIQLELLSGARTERELERLHRRLSALHQLPATESVWDGAARLAFRLRRKGNPVPHADALIGATALSADVAVLHADQHFDTMAKLEGLRVESYVGRLRQVAR